MKKLLPNIFKALSLFALCLVLFSTRCQDDIPTRANITVVDSLEVPVKGALLYIHPGEVTDDAVKSGYVINATTNDAGQFTQDFELPAILSVEASAVIGGDTIYGCRILQLQEEETTSIIVELKYPTPQGC